jgi:hypothetical protein
MQRLFQVPLTVETKGDVRVKETTVKSRVAMAWDEQVDEDSEVSDYR